MTAESIRYESGDLSYAADKPHKFECGVHMLCTKGHAVLSTGAHHFEMEERSEIIYLSGTLIRRVKASPDFHVRILLFSRRLLQMAVLPFDNACFRYLHENPWRKLTAGAEDTRYWKCANLWMDMAENFFQHTYVRKELKGQIMLNYMHGWLLWVISSTTEQSSTHPKGFSRKQLICHKFLSMIHEQAGREHSIAYYASRLCVSTRYLSEACRIHFDGKTPKDLVDEQLILEIQARLLDPRLTVMEIARELNFCDSSYMCRFFRLRTGITPMQFRHKNTKMFNPET